MHDADKLKLAREAAAKVYSEDGFPARARHMRNGKCDDLEAVQSALAAINALDPQLAEAVGLLRRCKNETGAMASSFERALDAFLAKQGDA